MSFFEQHNQNRTHQTVLLSVMSLSLLISGCQVYPKVQRKSLTELYYEAVAASQNTPDRNGAMHESLPPAVLPPVGEPLPVLQTPLPEDIRSFEPPEPVPLPEHNSSDEAETIPLIPDEQIPQVRSSRTGWQKAGGTTTAAAGRHRSKVRQVSHTKAPATTITEFFEDTDIRQALQSLSTQAEIPIIVDSQVGGVVNAVIEDEPFEVALKKVLLPAGLVHRKTPEGEYLVGVPDPSSSLFSQLSEQVEYYPLHLSPEELSKMMAERDSKFIRVIESRNRILIEAPPEIAETIVQKLQKFDTPIPQVELEAIVCVISPDRGFKSGLDWGHAVTLNGSEVLNLGLTGLAFTGSAAGQGLSNAFSDFAVTSAFVKLLAQEGYLSIRAAPRVTARDGDQAKIAITRESFFSTQPQSDSTFFRQEIETVEAGIQMDITPIIRGDNITVKIEKAEVSEDIRTSQINTGITENPFPQINRRTVSTTVHVKDGETIVIGGLVQRQMVDRIAKVPVLGDIPYMGRMFQTVEQKEQDAEVVIFICPRLVHPSGCQTMPSNVAGP